MLTCILQYASSYTFILRSGTLPNFIHTLSYSLTQTIIILQITLTVSNYTHTHNLKGFSKAVLIN